MTTKKAAPTPTTATPNMRREWQAELRDIRRQQKAIERNHKRLVRATTRGITAARRAVELFERRTRRVEAAMVRRQMKDLRVLTQRAQILEGRLG
jgi:hypothetical protein